MNYKGFEIDNKYIVDGKITWESGNNGDSIRGTKNGVRYYIKKNTNVRYPEYDPSRGEELYKTMLEAAEFVENKQKKLAANMAGLSFDADRIAVEEQNFWDDDHYFVTITRFVENAEDYHNNYSHESAETKKSIFYSMAEVLSKLHDHKVIHCDLKEGNIMLVKKGAKYDAYLIDFDASLPADDIPAPDKVPHTDSYESPEFVIYTDAAEKGNYEDVKPIITVAMDIFTLGIIYHTIWTGDKPDYTDKTCPALGSFLVNNMADRPIISTALDEKIGPKNGATYMSLVSWMLALDPSERPTAKQVMQVLNDELIIPQAYVVGSDTAPFTGLWSTHTYMADYNEDDLRAKGVISFQKVNEDGYKYLVRTESGEETMTIQELLANGYIARKGVKLVGPWESDEIVYADASDISAKRIVSIRNVQNAAGTKFYEVIDQNGTKSYRTAKSLIADGLAKKAPEPDGGELDAESFKMWSEDAIYLQFNAKYIKTKNIVKVLPEEAEGEHVYRICYGDGKEDKVLPSKVVQLLGILTRKM